MDVIYTGAQWLAREGNRSSYNYNSVCVCNQIMLPEQQAWIKSETQGFITVLWYRKQLAFGPFKKHRKVQRSTAAGTRSWDDGLNVANCAVSCRVVLHLLWSGPLHSTGKFLPDPARDNWEVEKRTVRELLPRPAVSCSASAACEWRAMWSSFSTCESMHVVVWNAVLGITWQLTAVVVVIGLAYLSTASEIIQSDPAHVLVVVPGAAAAYGIGRMGKE